MTGRTDRGGLSAETVIIGGGIAGVGVAYYLAEHGAPDILLVERDQFGAGATGGSFGGVRQQFSHPLEIELSRRGLEFWRTCAEKFDVVCPFHQDGYLFLTGDEEIAAGLRAAAQLQHSLGLTNVHVLQPEEVTALAPWLNADGLLLGCHSPQDGRVNPMDGLAALVTAARRLGVRFANGHEVSSLTRTPDGWRIDGTTSIRARQVVVAAGVRSPALVAPFGVAITLWPKRQYGALTPPITLDGQTPLTIELDTGLQVCREGPGLLLAVLSAHDPEDYTADDMLFRFAELAEKRAPILRNALVARTTVGFTDHGGDGHPYLGQVEEGLWMIAGFNGHGTMHGPPAAKLLADLMVGRPDPIIDAALLDPHRRPGQGDWMQAALRGTPNQLTVTHETDR